MKRRVISVVLGLMVMSAPIMVAAETAVVTVKGLVCSFCAQGIKKSFKKNNSVENVDVDLDKKLVMLEVKKGATLSDKEIEETIKDAGFNVVKIERQ